MATVKKLGILSFGKFFAITGFMNGVFSTVAYFIVSSLVNTVWAAKTEEIQSMVFQEAGEFAAFSPQIGLPEKLLPSLSVLGIIGILAASTIIGFIMGVLIAINYNSISKLIGGLEMDIE